MDLSSINLNGIIVKIDYLIRKVMSLLDGLMKTLGIETTVAETTTVEEETTTTVAP